jgi:hypothetical protein
MTKLFLKKATMNRALFHPDVSSYFLWLMTFSGNTRQPPFTRTLAGPCR